MEVSRVEKCRVVAEARGWIYDDGRWASPPCWLLPDNTILELHDGNIFTNPAALMAAEEWLLRQGWQKEEESVYGDEVMVVWKHSPKLLSVYLGGPDLITARAEAVYEAVMAMKGEGDGVHS